VSIFLLPQQGVSCALSTWLSLTFRQALSVSSAEESLGSLHSNRTKAGGHLYSFVLSIPLFSAQIQGWLSHKERDFPLVISSCPTEEIPKSWFQPENMDDARELVKDRDPMIVAAANETPSCLDWMISDLLP
jgi:hypothetical protein